MELEFVWKGDPTGDLDIEEVKKAITETLERDFESLISKSATVNLTNDVRKATVVGIVVSGGKRLLRIVYKPYENKTTVEPLSEKK